METLLWGSIIFLSFGHSFCINFFWDPGQEASTRIPPLLSENEGVMQFPPLLNSGGKCVSV